MEIQINHIIDFFSSNSIVIGIATIFTIISLPLSIYYARKSRNEKIVNKPKDSAIAPIFTGNNPVVNISPEKKKKS